MANLGHFVCDKNKMIDRKKFYLYTIHLKAENKIFCLTAES